MRVLLWICFTAVLPAQVTNLTGEDARLFERAKHDYYEAVSGDETALKESGRLFHKLHANHSGNPLVLAYLGSTRLLQAARAFAPWSKGKLAKEGLRMLDQAVENSPDSVEIRFLRAVSTSHLPGFFKRREQSDADFAWLAPRVGEAVASSRLDARLGAAALYYRGLALERSSDLAGARAAWREAARLGQGTRAGADAQKKLDSLTADRDAQ